MEISSLVFWNAFITLVLAPVLYSIRQNASELKRVDILLNKTREEIATNYVTKSDNKDIMKSVMERFDKLEVLLDSSFISANLDYACHPVFQQLVQTGINTSTVSGWFSNIIKNGVDPFVHNKLWGCSS